MSSFGDVPMETTETTFKDMPIEPVVDNHGMLEIYRKMMLIDLFQTQYGGWVSNLPLHIKVLMEVMLLFIATIFLIFLNSLKCFFGNAIQIRNIVFWCHIRHL